MQRNLRHLMLGIVLLLAAACGTGTNTDSEAGAASDDATTTPEAITEVTAESPEGGDPNPGAEVDQGDTDKDIGSGEGSQKETQPQDPTPATPLGEALRNAPVSGGWPLPPGRWTTGAFGHQINFTTDRELVLVAEKPGSVFLGLPGVTNTALVLADAAFVNTGGIGANQVPAATTTEDITELLNNTTGVDDLGSLDNIPMGAVPWWDFSLDETDPPGSSACSLGARCLAMAFTIGNEPILGLVDEPVRLYTVPIAGNRIGVWVVGSGPGAAALVESAEALLASMALAGGEVEAANSGPQLLSILQGRPSIPPGSYRALFGDLELSLDAHQESETIGVDIVTDNGVAFADRSGVLGLFMLAWPVSPDAEQRAVFGDVRDDTLRHPGPLETVEQFEDWMTQLLTVTDTGTIEVMGSEVPWWDTTVTEGVDCSLVSFGPGTCVAVLDMGPGIWLFSDSFPTRVYFLEEYGLFLSLEVLGASTMSEVEAALLPVLDDVSLRRISS